MNWSAWLPLALVCLLGAMSPGPSLAVVARHALRGGARDGIVCAMAHGVGILLWALLMANGLGVLLIEQPDWFAAVQLAGAGFLSTRITGFTNAVIALRRQINILCRRLRELSILTQKKVLGTSITGFVVDASMV